MRTGIADLPLHKGKVPQWMFKKMKKMAKGVVEVILEEYGPLELLKRLSDPLWFQSFACVIGFDWHSSGTTTVLMGALKEILNFENTGLCVAGGKGMANQTLNEIQLLGERLNLSDSKIRDIKYASRICAKVDSAVLQDGHGIYHHTIVFSENGDWAVIQQGMNPYTKTARRYHWLSLVMKDPLKTPHTGLIGKKMVAVMDLTASPEKTKEIMIDELENIKRRLPGLSLLVPRTHPVLKVPWLRMPRKLNWNSIELAIEYNVHSLKELLNIRGIGAATLRALALVAELVHGSSVSWEDPVKYAFTVGGKDGVPYPLDIKTIDSVFSFLHEAVQNAKLGNKERLLALRQLLKLKKRIKIIPEEEFPAGSSH